MKVLFICTGNTCRSPMAEALLKDKYEEAEVKSAGIFAGGTSQGANEHAIQALKTYGITLNHQSQQVNEKLLDWADVVLTMTTQHKQSLILHYPNYQHKYFTLKEYVSESDKRLRDELKKLYADYEVKRSLFTRENQHKFDHTTLDDLILDHFQADIQKIQQLESNLMNDDIPDPFGGDLVVYQNTLEELHKHISLLIKKIDK